VYENFTDIGVSAWHDPAWATDPIGTPLADNSIFRDVYGYIEQNALFGLYDVHVDGHGVTYGSMLRPILNMRPKFRYRTMNCPARASTRRAGSRVESGRTAAGRRTRSSAWARPGRDSTAARPIGACPSPTIRGPRGSSTGSRASSSAIRPTSK